MFEQLIIPDETGEREVLMEVSDDEIVLTIQKTDTGHVLGKFRAKDPETVLQSMRNFVDGLYPRETIVTATATDAPSKQKRVVTGDRRAL